VYNFNNLKFYAGIINFFLRYLIACLKICTKKSISRPAQICTLKNLPRLSFFLIRRQRCCWTTIRRRRNRTQYLLWIKFGYICITNLFVFSFWSKWQSFGIYIFDWILLLNWLIWLVFIVFANFHFYHSALLLWLWLVLFLWLLIGQSKVADNFSNTFFITENM
jgi:hypothetical protein